VVVQLIPIRAIVSVPVPDLVSADLVRGLDRLVCVGRAAADAGSPQREERRRSSTGWGESFGWPRKRPAEWCGALRALRVRPAPTQGSARESRTEEHERRRFRHRSRRSLELVPDRLVRGGKDSGSQSALVIHADAAETRKLS